MKTRYRSIFISDLHLGSRGARAEAVEDFLKHHASENLFLVGDIIDFWALSRGVYFPTSHQNVLRKIMKRAKQGTRVTYIVGNHDDVVRGFIPVEFGEIEVCNETIYESADGKKYLIIHGDQFDQVVKYAKWLAFLGDIGYEILLKSNRIVNKFRSMFGLGYWSLAAYMKKTVKGAVNFIGNYEQAVVRAARDHKVNGVVCGHIHSAAMSQFDDILYLNTGDFVESCTAIVEHMDGTMELIHWPEPLDASLAEAA
jgi:UDP-2,3-diacylglucosamine pyrophosphatase LpxH